VGGDHPLRSQGTKYELALCDGERGEVTRGELRGRERRVQSQQLALEVGILGRVRDRRERSRGGERLVVEARELSDPAQIVVARDHHDLIGGLRDEPRQEREAIRSRARGLRRAAEVEVVTHRHETRPR